MKRNYIVIALVLGSILVGGFIPRSQDWTPTASQIKVHQSFENSEEYNISSYLDFAEATSEIILDNLMNESDGSVWRVGDSSWELLTLESSLADYYWAIAGLTRMYEASEASGNPNTTLSVMISRAANRMVYLFSDDEHLGYGVNTYSPYEARSTKRPGVQAYAYEALTMAESVNASLDFTVEKQNAIECLTEFLYDEVNGGLHFFTMRNGSLDVPTYLDEIYPNDGKRLDHISLGAITLYNAGVDTNNSTLIMMANSSMTFVLNHMKKTFQGEYYGFKLAVTRNGSNVEVAEFERPGEVVISDLNAILLRGLLRAYEVTENVTYLEEAKLLFNALIKHNWDTTRGGWFTETLQGVPFDPLDDGDVKYFKFTEIQFQMVFALLELYELTDELFHIRLCIDIIELILSNLWDITGGGFVQNGNQDWAPLSEDWKVHLTAVQGQGILALHRMWSYGLPIISFTRVNPVSPRPTDDIWVSSSVLDDDGIDTVYVNYSMEVDDNITQGILILDENPEISGLYNSTFGFLNDTTRVNFYVYANDSLGNRFIAGSFFFIVREDTYEPMISLRQIYPEEVAAGDNLILEFGTYEFPLHSAIESCKINWKVNDGYFAEENLTLAAVDGDELVWLIELGSFAAGDVITYYVEALDESGNLGISAIFRLTIEGDVVVATPLMTWQVLAFAGLVMAPGFGFAYVWTRRQSSKDKQRELKKAARKRGRRARGKGRSRSRSRGGN